MSTDFRKLIAEVKDYPKPGISFKDLTPLLSSPAEFREAVALIAAWPKTREADVIVAPEARGFLWGGALAQHIGLPLVPVRKPGKLPRATVSATYQLEYGTDTLHMHKDAIRPGQKVVIVDDVLATGGTAKAIAELVTGLGGKVTGLAFVIELGFLKGRDKLSPLEVFSLVSY